MFSMFLACANCNICSINDGLSKHPISIDSLLLQPWPEQHIQPCSELTSMKFISSNERCKIHRTPIEICILVFLANF